jgi:hypothetical protein
MSEFMVKWAIYGPAVDPDILHLMGKFWFVEDSMQICCLRQRRRVVYLISLQIFWKCLDGCATWIYVHDMGMFYSTSALYNGWRWNKLENIISWFKLSKDYCLKCIDGCYHESSEDEMTIGLQSIAVVLEYVAQP